MEREFQHAPMESRSEPAEKEKVSLGGIWGSMKERLATYAGLVFRDNGDAELRKFEKNLDQSLDLSRSAGEYFRFLIPQSLHKPQVDYEHQEKETPLIVRNSLMQALDQARQDAPTVFPDYQRQTLEIIRHENKESIGEVEESSGKNSIIQSMKNIVAQDEGKNLIIEQLGNKLWSDKNYARSELVVKNIETGAMIDLNLLLPKDYRFVPSFLDKEQVDVSQVTGKAIIRPLPVDLKAYYGPGTLMNDDFYCSVETRKVVYGNIAKKGNMLGVLHEIAHSWQMAYGLPVATVEFETYHRDLIGGLAIINESRKKLEEGVISQNEFRATTSIWKQKLEEMEVSLDASTMTASRSGVEKGQLRIRAKENLDDIYFIRGGKYAELIADFEREERDAWAHAIKVLRFLRKRGVDLDPGLRSLKDIQEVVHPCLQTYQKHIDILVKSPTHKTRFVRKLPAKSNSQEN